MTDDLSAIQMLSKNFFDDFIANRPRGKSGTRYLEERDDKHVAKAEKISKMYENELGKHPDDVDVKASLAEHLLRISYMYYESCDKSIVKNGWGEGYISRHHVENAENCCKYAYQSYDIFPSSAAAMSLAEMFDFAEFHYTTIYWLQQAEQLAASANLSDSMTEAKAARMMLQSEGKTTDPKFKLFSKTLFPTASTAGLQFENQDTGHPESDDLNIVSTSKSPGGGCISILSTVSIITYIFTIFSMHK